jgi:antirestriction protein ArdC
MTKTTSFVSPYKLITDKIVSALEQGVAAWVKPWKSKGAVVASMPMNFTTKTTYRGINTVMLYCACIDNGWDVPAFATFKQIKAAGGQVVKGAKGEHVYFMSKIEREPKTEEEAAKVNENGKYEQFILKGYTVFNIAQTEGLEVNIEGMAKPSEIPADVLDLCNVVGVKLAHGGDRAFYQPVTDKVTMPAPEAFETLSHYKATAFHEVGHATGHADRLNRTFGKKFGDQAYAYEELVAELSAAFLCMEFGVEGQLRHPEYIASWIKVLKDDDRAFYKAAADAQKALDWIRERAQLGNGADDMREAA